jgi:hypothetical protein
VFDSSTSTKSDVQASLTPEPIVVPNSADESPTGVGARGGNPRAGAAIATQNGQESMRFTSGAGMAVSGSVSLKGPAAFASGSISGGAGIGISGGAGIGVSGGAGIGISGGAGISISGGAGIGISGGAGIGISGGAEIGVGASAGVPASAGAFAGLRVSASKQADTRIETSRLLPPRPTTGPATDRSASFAVGGQASADLSGSLSADVGASTSLRARIQFEE